MAEPLLRHRVGGRIKPVVGGESSQTSHLGYVISGRIHIAADDGEEIDLGPGDVYRIEPGHDAWVLGDEPFEAGSSSSSSG